MFETNNKINYDLSILSLEELIKTYESILEFLKFLEENQVNTDKGE